MQFRSTNQGHNRSEPRLDPMLTEPETTGQLAPRIRPPRPSDGAAVHDLIARCPPLDPNSLYCNLLQCTHFSCTSAVAQQGEDIVGFVAGYRPPELEDSLFVWQVAVAEQARGQGLGQRMVEEILLRPGCRGIRFLQATITAENPGSWAMFERLARQLQARSRRAVAFDAVEHFAGRHDTEHELVIGPFDSSSIKGKRD
jgi:L-2,4-diaminobutyric acid acetyltransferase